MSYDLSICHPSVKQRIVEGLEWDGFEHHPIEATEMKRFLARLVAYGYQLEDETPRRKGFIKQINACPIQVSVYDNEIAFSVPYWNSEQAIFEALQDASELCDTGVLALFNPQIGEWFDPDP